MKNVKKKIFEIGTNIIIFFFVPMMVTSLVSLTSNPPKLISASSFEQDICSAIRLEIQKGNIYFPYPHTLEESDTVTFLFRKVKRILGYDSVRADILGLGIKGSYPPNAHLCMT